MSKILTFHSFRRGTGKSTLVSNIASLLTVQGLRVGIVDTDFQFSRLHRLFKLEKEDINYSLNDYLRGKCDIQATVLDVTAQLGADIKGKLFFVPVSTTADDAILRDGYDGDLLNKGLNNLINNLELDYLVIDTHSGLNEETLLTTAISDTLIIVIRPDQQDYQGTAIIVDVAQHLQVSNLLMVVNKMPKDFNYDNVRKNVEDAYNSTVAGVLPHAEEMIALDNAGFFVLHYPEHEITKSLKEIISYIQDK